MTLALLTLTYFFSYMDRQILAILLEPIKADLQLDDTQLGLLAGLAFACSGSARDAAPTTTSEPSTPAPEDATPAPVAQVPAGKMPSPEVADDGQPCGQMTRGACLASRRCTLVVSPEKRGAYSCRAEQAPCEAGIAQSALFSRDAAEVARCTERAGCQVDSGSCYCPCGGPAEDEKSCSCVCGGGAPPNCAPGAVER